MLNFSDHLGRERTATRHEIEELGNLRRIFRAAVCEQQDRGFSWSPERHGAIRAVTTFPELERASSHQIGMHSTLIFHHEGHKGTTSGARLLCRLETDLCDLRMIQ